ncbi:Itaconate transport protein, partial [Lachnellula suecica]
MATTTTTEIQKLELENVEATGPFSLLPTRSEKDTATTETATDATKIGKTRSDRPSVVEASDASNSNVVPSADTNAGNEQPAATVTSPDAKETPATNATNTANDDPWSVWSTRSKKAIIFSGSFASLLSPLSSQIYFPALEPIAKDLHVSNTLVNLSISTYIILQGIAPTFSAQLSDAAGRRPIYLVCLALFFAANIGLGAQNSYAALLVLRCLQSAGSSGIAALSNAIAADVATPAERGSCVSFASALPMDLSSVDFCLNTPDGIPYSGFLRQWRASSGFPSLCFFPETCRKVVGNGSIPPPKWNRSYTNVLYERRLVIQGRAVPSRQRDELAKSRSLKFPNPLAPITLLLERECGFALLYSSILACSFYAVLALIPTQFSSIYNFNELQVSLCYIPFGVGALVAAFSRGRFIDGNFQRHAKRLGIVVEKNKRTDLSKFPIERARLEVAIPTIILTTACSLGFGWMLEKKVHVSGPLILLFCIGFCASASLNCIAALLLDLYGGRAGTVTASNNLLRCALGAGATAATVPMIDG